MKCVHDADYIIIQKVANSGKLISAAEDCITAAANDQCDEFNTALEQLYNAYQSINQGDYVGSQQARRLHQVQVCWTASP